MALPRVLSYSSPSSQHHLEFGCVLVQPYTLVAVALAGPLRNLLGLALLDIGVEVRTTPIRFLADSYWEGEFPVLDPMVDGPRGDAEFLSYGVDIKEVVHAASILKAKYSNGIGGHSGLAENLGRATLGPADFGVNFCPILVQMDLPGAAMSCNTAFVTC